METKGVITDEVKELTQNIVESINKNNFERVENIFNKTNPKVKEGIFKYLDRVITSTDGYSDEHPKKELKLLFLKDLRMYLRKYCLLNKLQS